jgi:hypothetical protein
MGANPNVELARRVLSWIRDRSLTEFSRRDAFRHLHSAQLPKVTDLDPALALLVAHEYLAPTPSVHSPAGGRPSQRFRVNPLWTKPTEPTKPGAGGGSVGSVSSVPMGANR